MLIYLSTKDRSRNISQTKSQKDKNVQKLQSAIDELPRSKKPLFVRWTKTIPLTPTFKIKREQLKQVTGFCQEFLEHSLLTDKCSGYIACQFLQVLKFKIISRVVDNGFTGRTNFMVNLGSYK